MKKKSETPKKIRVTLAAPTTPQPGIERKHKGGELSWTLPVGVSERDVKRALAAARLMIIGCVGLEAFERNLRAQGGGEIEEQLAESVKTAKKAKAEDGK